MEKLQPSYIANENVKWYSYCGPVVQQLLNTSQNCHITQQSHWVQFWKVPFMPLYFYKRPTLICVFVNQKEIQKGSSFTKKDSSLFYPISAYKRCHMNALLSDGWVSLYLLKRFENRYSNKRASWWLTNKESTWNTGAVGDVGLIPGSGRSPGKRNGYPRQYSSGKFHGLRSLAGYSLWGRRVGHD